VIPETSIGPTTWVQRLWYGLFRLFGWRYAGDLPTDSKYVIVVAPHTSNWDFVWTMATAIVLEVQLSWFAKHSIFKPGVDWFFRRWGGIPIRRQEVLFHVTFPPTHWRSKGMIKSTWKARRKNCVNATLRKRPGSGTECPLQN